MRIGETELTYCINIHPCTTLDEVRHSILNYVVDVKSRVSPALDFGVGLRFSAQAAKEILPIRDEFAEFLRDNGLYSRTVNGFPYGEFNAGVIKENVYEPSWEESERLEYTIALAEIMAALTPEGESASISTPPVGFGKSASEAASVNLIAIANYLELLHKNTGRFVYLALEPEPNCYLENANDTANFFEKLRELAGDGLGHLGVCLDTCHAAVEFLRPRDEFAILKEAEIPVPKVQVSSALAVPVGVDAYRLLKDFDEPRYLHQTRIRHRDGVERFVDIAPAFDWASEHAVEAEWRVHFHVPIHKNELGGLKTTSALITEQFLKEAARHNALLEVETYSFDAMPGEKENLAESIAEEILWVANLLR